LAQKQICFQINKLGHERSLMEVRNG